VPKVVHAITLTAGERLLRLPEVEARTGLKKSAIYAGMKAGTFPACLKLGIRASAWSQSAIDAWISDRIRQATRSR
jgi:prophage regulatory protein